MSKRKRLSRQDILRAQQRSSFVGRVEQLEAFESNLKHLQVAEDGIAYPSSFLFNIYGQGGVGKTTLLKRFEDISKRYGAVVALTDEGIESVPEVMAEFARQMRAQGRPCETFDERYKVYRQRRKELEADPEAPQGFSAFVGKTVAKVGFSLGRKVPGADVAIDMIDEGAVVDSAGEWATYVARKIKNKDEVQLVNEPVEVLTPLFLNDLGEIFDRQIVLLFDTFERTDEVLEKWLLDVVENRYSELPINCIWAISGREQLNPNRWSGYDPVPLAVEPFTVVEATHFLQRRGVTNTEVIEKILDLSERLPLMLATLAESASNDPSDLDEASGTAVERFLKWVDNPAKRTLAVEAALPQRLNKDVVALLNDEEQSESLFEWLKAMPFVRERSDGWAYHDVVRPQMLRYLRKRSVNEWEQKHLQLANYYGDICQQLDIDGDDKYKDVEWQRYALEHLYHRLCGHPQQELAPALGHFIQALKQKRNFAQRWSAVMERAGLDVENSDVRRWGKRLFDGLKAYDEDHYDKTIAAFTKLLSVKKLDSRNRAVVLAWRGEVYRLDSSYESALSDFDCAIELDSEYEWAIAHRGETHQQLECYEEALADFNRAIELDAEYKWAIANRGGTYQQLERYEEALADFNRAIELDAEYKWAIANRGETYRLMHQYEEAMHDFDLAISQDPEEHWPHEQKGRILGQLGHFEQAVMSLTKAHETGPECHTCLGERAEIYEKMKRYSEALSDYNIAIGQEPDYHWAYERKGILLIKMSRFHDAIAALTEAHRTNPQCVNCIAKRADAYESMGQFNIALLDIETAIELNPNYHWGHEKKGIILKRLGHLEEAILSFGTAHRTNSACPTCIMHRASAYVELKHYEKALEDYRKASELIPDSSWILSNRGLASLLSRRYHEALTDLTAAIEIEPSSSSYCCRALASICLKQDQNANKDIITAIDLAKHEYIERSDNHRNTINLGLYFLISLNIDKSIYYYRTAIANGATYIDITDGLSDLEKLLTVVPHHPYINEAKSLLNSSLHKPDSFQ